MEKKQISNNVLTKFGQTYDVIEDLPDYQRHPQDQDFSQEPNQQTQ